MNINDNVLVYSTKDRQDFFQICLYNDATAEQPQVVSLTRYCVPGRLDLYNFDYAPSRTAGIGSRVRYFTDTGLSMPNALKMLRNDLNKKAVVKLLVDICSAPRRPRHAFRLIEYLLNSVGRGTKAHKAISKLIVDINLKRSENAIPQP